MKILHTADWHIGNFPGPEQDGKNLRALDTMACIQYLHNTARDEYPDVILISGDMFHQARVWADRGLNEVKTAIEAIEALAMVCPVIVMRGTPNHDGIEQFEMLRAAFSGTDSNVYIVTEPKVIQIRNPRILQKISVAVLPGFDRGVYRAKFPGLSKEEENQVFTEELGKIVLALKAQCDPSAPSVLMTHYTVPGCNTESGQTQFFSQFEPVILPDVLDAAGFDLVALGHIHRPQQLESCRNTFYSGAINAMNFNDEGQDRGFWVHDINGAGGDIHSEFFKTPSREFLTIKMDDQDITSFNAGGHKIVYGCLPDGQLFQDKIVRILYSCSDESNKALNKALLEREIYDGGAFWVSEISPEQVTMGTAKNELSELMNPETNLIAYLSEKGETQERIGTIIDAARPIIAEAFAGAVTTRLTGTFTPLDIEVKNYRNYAEERFNFRDISFCTINGKNGAGKSSLFMDAILDCLYEEPREGELTGWIRKSDEARSGSITFSFSIGDKTFRVTRTRAKSGKATLNLSELVDSEWVNRSHERIKDTQDDIVNVLGMDSMTFRSCALIMQDQYGLFLNPSNNPAEAKEIRMKVLGDILGLGIYNDMEQLSRVRATDAVREVAKRKTMIETLSRDTADEESLTVQLDTSAKTGDQLTGERKGLDTERDSINAELTRRREAAQRAASLQTDITNLRGKESGARSNLTAQETIIREADAVLVTEAEIHIQSEQHGSLLTERQQTSQELATLDIQLAACSEAQAEAGRLTNDLTTLQAEKETVSRRITECEGRLAREPELQDAAAEYARVKGLISELELKSTEYMSLTDSLSRAGRDVAEQSAIFTAEARTRKEKIARLESKVAMLASSGCLDIDNAECVFLADAKTADAELEPYRTACTQWKADELKRIAALENGVGKLEAQRVALGYDANALTLLRTSAQSLERHVREYEQMAAVREQLTLHKERLSAIEVSIPSATERLTQVNAKALEYKKLSARKNDLLQVQSFINEQIPKAAAWVEREQQLPVIKERKAAAEKRIVDLRCDLDDILRDIADKESAHKSELLQSVTTELDARMSELDRLIKANEERTAAVQMEIGRLRQRLDDIQRKKQEIAQIVEESSAFAAKAAIYDTLKTAFSQDGIPHNIIRSILPTLSATANNILGQMTGGRMGIDFVTDKILKSNSKKEVPTLDIVIEEYGKDTLPYLSKSGGEKVKASLSVILALAETKSSQAGIQLGMLFIDEPPFLDADGVGAYCDALETIQRRYSNLKVMAITHDPAMKARFPQSIDIIKTDNGSRVEAA